MEKIKKENWIPVDGLTLEDNALQVVRSEDNDLVVAGPGAGKTELLAQRACYLLQTNTCKFPQKILAISFKRDAAFNLKDRVRKRCGEELSKRFVSQTFDSFAKQILDHFRHALPKKYQFKKDYRIVFSDPEIIDYYNAEDEDYVRTTSTKQILNHHTAKQLPFNPTTKEEAITLNAWKGMLKGDNPKVSFRMIMRLAELIINSNPTIKSYLQNTYSYVFLDEFQDTTETQYDFFKTCFLDMGKSYTAVGDDKQKIMGWAGAKDTIFEDFIADTGAKRIPLIMNFRSAPQLVKLQNYLAKNLLNKDEVSTPSPKWPEDAGSCIVWLCKDADIEQQLLLATLKDLIENKKVNPRDICILVKQQLNKYVGSLIGYLNANGIRSRDESTYQDFLTEEVTLYIINFLYAIFKKNSSENRGYVFSFLANVRSEFEDDQLLRMESILSKIIKKFQTDYAAFPLSDVQIIKLIDDIIAIANKERIIATFTAYKDISFFDELIETFKKMLIDLQHANSDIIDNLDTIAGKGTIPVMTIHKSKGLEYHSVIFVGLEDGAFWSYQSQADEDKNAFFVALSRAKENVIFTFSKLRNGYEQKVEKILEIFKALKDSGVVTIEKKL